MLFRLLLEYIERGERNESRPKEERVVYADAKGIDLQERVKVILYCLESGRAFDGLVSSGLHIISWPLSFLGYLQTGGRHNACRGGPKTNSTLANSVRTPPPGRHWSRRALIYAVRPHFSYDY